MQFEVDYAGHRLRGEHCEGSGGAHLLALHGGGNAQQEVFSTVRDVLLAKGIGVTAFDCVGHGQTGGDKQGSSLLDRTRQARAVIAATRPPTAIIGASMGAYNALRLSEQFDLEALVLVVPGVYTPAAYEVPFGPEFSRLIRQPRSWQDSDAWDIVGRFRGRLVVIAGEADAVVPLEIPRRLHDAAVNARWRSLMVVPGAGHSGLMTGMLEDPLWRPWLLDHLGYCLEG